MALAIKKINFLESQRERMVDEIKDLQDVIGFEYDDMPQAARQDDSNDELAALLDRVVTLEIQFGEIQNSTRRLEEAMGLEPGPYFRLAYRWEGPPPKTFRYNGHIYHDNQPILCTATGPAGRIPFMPSLVKDGRWVMKSPGEVPMGRWYFYEFRFVLISCVTVDVAEGSGSAAAEDKGRVSAPVEGLRVEDLFADDEGAPKKAPAATPNIAARLSIIGEIYL